MLAVASDDFRFEHRAIIELKKKKFMVRFLGVGRCGIEGAGAEPRAIGAA